MKNVPRGKLRLVLALRFGLAGSSARVYVGWAAAEFG
jgi:hypothetical protein